MLLTSRITKPKSPPAVVDRLRLYQRLDGWRDVRAVVIHAGAGYGKSLLVSRWLEVAGLETRTAWLTLDEGDADPHRFIHHVAAALATMVPDALEMALLVLSDSQGSPDRALTGLLGAIAELAQTQAGGQEIILVLDDLHRVQAPQIDALLLTMLEHSPANLHFFLLARYRTELPLARLYAHGRILALTADDLRFTEEEVWAYLLQHGFAAPNAPDVAQLARRVEGWVTALQLAILSQRQREDVAALVGALQGHHGWLAEFLTDEVLSHLTPDLRLFLLQTSILDEFDAGLCAAVTEDAGAYTHLGTVVRANLFLIQTGGEQARFRYHQLFRELLQHRLAAQVPASAVAALHRRAAARLEAEGQIRAAIGHLLAAGDDDEAAALVERRVRQTLVQDLYRAQTLLALLPHALVARRPQLMIDRCLIAILFDDKRALDYVQEAALTLQHQQAPAAVMERFHAELLVLRMVSHFLLRQLDATRDTSRQAQPMLAVLDNLYVGIYQFIQMHLHGNQGKHTDMVTAAQIGMAAFEQAGFATGVTAMRRELAKGSMRAGNGAEAARMFEQLCSAFGHNRQTAIRDWVLVYDAAAENSYLLNQLEQASAYQRAAMDLALLLQDHELVEMIDTLGKMVNGRFAANDTPAGAHRNAASAAGFSATSDILNARKVQLLLAAERYDLAWQLIKAAGIQLELMQTDHIHRRLATFLWAYIGNGVDLELVTPVLKRTLANAQQHGDRLHQLQILAMTAWQQWKLQHAEAARVTLAAAMQLACDTGYVRVLLDNSDLLHLLQESGVAFPPVSPRKPRILPTSEGASALTEQERRVLGFLAAEYTYEQIAAEMVISVNTVRTHVRHLYKKLAVRRRDQAIAAMLRAGAGTA